MELEGDLEVFLVEKSSSACENK